MPWRVQVPPIKATTFSIEAAAVNYPFGVAIASQKQKSEMPPVYVLGSLKTATVALKREKAGEEDRIRESVSAILSVRVINAARIYQLQQPQKWILNFLKFFSPDDR
jgi:hypothetical protein